MDGFGHVQLSKGKLNILTITAMVIQRRTNVTQTEQNNNYGHPEEDKREDIHNIVTIMFIQRSRNVNIIIVRLKIIIVCSYGHYYSEMLVILVCLCQFFLYKSHNAAHALLACVLQSN